MSTQPTLFPITYTLHPRDPHVEPQDTLRLSGQNARLLEMLRRGPKTNQCMLERGMAKYTSRISDLRKAGHTITARRLSGGLFLYTLEG